MVRSQEKVEHQFWLHPTTRTQAVHQRQARKVGRRYKDIVEVEQAVQWRVRLSLLLDLESPIRGS